MQQQQQKYLGKKYTKHFENNDYVYIYMYLSFKENMLLLSTWWLHHMPF